MTDQEGNTSVTKYSKMAAQVVATVLAALVPYLTGDGLTATAWVNVAIIAAGAAAVFTAPNVPGASYTKVILAAVTAALTVLSSAIAGGVTSAEWLQITLAVLGALGVGVVPNVDRDTGANLSQLGSLTGSRLAAAGGPDGKDHP